VITQWILGRPDPRVRVVPTIAVVVELGLAVPFLAAESVFDLPGVGFVNCAGECVVAEFDFSRQDLQHLRDFIDKLTENKTKNNRAFTF